MQNTHTESRLHFDIVNNGKLKWKNNISLRLAELSAGVNLPQLALQQQKQWLSCSLDNSSGTAQAATSCLLFGIITFSFWQIWCAAPPADHSQWVGEQHWELRQMIKMVEGLEICYPESQSHHWRSLKAEQMPASGVFVYQDHSKYLQGSLV